MEKVKIGRPKGKAILCKDIILKEALYLLDKKGPQGLSMRNLANRLNVTPMAIYNHFPDRSTLMRNLADSAYGEVTKDYESFSGTVLEKLHFLFVRYQEAVIRHPNLSISIFENSDHFSQEIKKITNHILELLTEVKVEGSTRRMWLDILVDFTHGSSIAIALNKSNQSNKSNIKNMSLRYKKELSLLLNMLSASIQK